MTDFLSTLWFLVVCGLFAWMGWAVIEYFKEKDRR